uniref:Uncharacterized protein n=1 Tax=Kalanchoe fedtschenkoi TaxID=63787 RepID=A0A7N0V5K0_KALFE
MTRRVNSVACIFLFLLMSSFVLDHACAARPLDELQHPRQSGGDEKYKSLLANVLQRAPVPPSGPSPCTFIPGQGSGGSCPAAAAATLNGKNFAGRTFPTRKVAPTHTHS